MSFYKSFSLLAAILLPVVSIQINATQAKSSVGHDDETQLLRFTSKQMQMADIKLAQLTPKYMDKRLYAPGEVQANGYTSYVVSPRVESVIVRRHAILGEHVEKGQALVTLFSEDVAQAQALYRISYADWLRAKKVTKDVISESQMLSAETDYIAAFSRLKAYGLSKQAIDLVAKDNSSALGEYTLRAERSGSVLSDDFQQGQRVSAGDTIMVLTDENELWIEARLAPNNRMPLAKGTKAQVILLGTNQKESSSYQAQVIQQAHTIDPITRTRIVRLKVKNTNHQLHPGLFVDVYFSQLTKNPILVVPETALLRGDDGDWLIYSAQETATHEHGTNDDHEQETVAHEHGINDDHEQEAVVHEHGTNDNHEQETATHEQDEHHHQANYSDQTTFIAQEVELGSVFRVFSPQKSQWLSWREIKGVSANSHFAITGAFFIAS
ncbi:MAG: efflux RND transporter periplasmic adaptor subunit, partial [Alteromonadales bacterium]|nr:efflux RND transporter periplasmic adaptor subunit [Alteromonadales bacterium]